MYLSSCLSSWVSSGQALGIQSFDLLGDMHQLTIHFRRKEVWVPTMEWLWPITLSILLTSKMLALGSLLSTGANHSCTLLKGKSVFLNGTGLLGQALALALALALGLTLPQALALALAGEEAGAGAGWVRLGRPAHLTAAPQGSTHFSRSSDTIFCLMGATCSSR